VVGGITERASDSRTTEKETTIQEEASVWGLTRGNKTYWTALKLQVTALISLETARNVNPTTPQQD